MRPLAIVFAILLLAGPALAQETIPNDVMVTFTVCLEGSGAAGDVCITGSHNEITNWGNGVVLSNVGGDLYEATVKFNAGAVADVEYKYRSDGCQNWEFDPNRTLTLPTDGTDTVVLDPESFNRTNPIGCGFSGPSDHDVTVCFQVCLQATSSSGLNCVIGDIQELGEWGTGLILNEVGPDIFQTCVNFPAGTLVPLAIQYKFQKDDCTSWENLPGGDPFANREFTLDNSAPAVVTLKSVWEDEDIQCQSVVTHPASWSTVKSSFRE